MRFLNGIRVRGYKGSDMKSLFRVYTWECIYLKIGRELNIEALNDKSKKHKRRWCDHLKRMPNNRLPLSVLNYHPTGRRDIGRSRTNRVLELIVT